MRTIIAISFFTAIFFNLLGNPIPMKLINELYLDENEIWSLELVQEDEIDFDNCRIEFSTGSSELFDGLEFNEEGLLVLIPENLLNPLPIIRSGDLVIFQEFIDNEWVTIDFISFGNYQDSEVNYPYDYQSLQRIYIEYDEWAGNFWLVKNNDPSIGTLYGGLLTPGTFKGYVFDIFQNPIANAIVNYHPVSENLSIETDENGYFENTNMYGKNYNITIYVDDVAYLDSTITVEPDSTTYCEFYLDYTSIENKEISYPEFSLSNYPNPFYATSNAGITISFSATEPTESTEKIISIYNQKGQKVRSLECIKSFDAQAEETLSHITWNGRNEKGKLVNSGVYFYTLEIDGQEVASNKMIVLR